MLGVPSAAARYVAVKIEMGGILMTLTLLSGNGNGNMKKFNDLGYRVAKTGGNT